MEKINFLAGIQDEYDRLEVKDSSTIYFILDTHRIYKGPYLFGAGLIENLEQRESFVLNGGGAPSVKGGESE